MPQVTLISEQKANAKRLRAKKDARYNIYLDRKYAFSIGEENLFKFKLKEGQKLAPRQIEIIKNEEKENKLLDLAINFLSYRPRSEKEVSDYLVKTICKYENLKWQDAKLSEVPTLVINKLKKYGYINDSEFIKWWIASRTRSRPKGRRIIELELIRKGINRDEIQNLLPKNSQAELNLAVKVLEKKKRTLANLSTREAQRKIFNYLGSRGFNIDTIKEAIAIFQKKG